MPITWWIGLFTVSHTFYMSVYICYSLLIWSRYSASFLIPGILFSFWFILPVRLSLEFSSWDNLFFNSIFISASDFFHVFITLLHSVFKSWTIFATFISLLFTCYLFIFGGAPLGQMQNSSYVFSPFISLTCYSISIETPWILWWNLWLFCKILYPGVHRGPSPLQHLDRCTWFCRRDTQSFVLVIFLWWDFGV